MLTFNQGSSYIPQELQQAWGSLKGAVSLPYDTAMAKWGRIKNLTGEADRIAEREFPNSERDSSQKNAFRHSLGTGMLTQELGGNPISAELAKRAGYIWEGLGLEENIQNPKYRQDTYHDLNANALGAIEGTKAKNQQELIAALKTMAQNSKVEAPPSFWQSSPGYMTRSVK